MICCQARARKRRHGADDANSIHLDAGTSRTPCYEHVDRNGGTTMAVADLPAFTRLLGVNVLHRSPERSEARLQPPCSSSSFWRSCSLGAKAPAPRARTLVRPPPPVWRRGPPRLPSPFLRDRRRRLTGRADSSEDVSLRHPGSLSRGAHFLPRRAATILAALRAAAGVRRGEAPARKT